MTGQRLTAETEATIRSHAAPSSITVRVLLAELDAVRGERDAMRKHLDAVYDSLNFQVQHHGDDELAPRVAQIKRERDEARTVTDEMVERAAQELMAISQSRWGELHEVWRAQYRDSARRALTAALGGGK